jgi:hypothetical protein
MARPEASGHALRRNTPEGLVDIQENAPAAVTSND